MQCLEPRFVHFVNNPPQLVSHSSIWILIVDTLFPCINIPWCHLFILEHFYTFFHAIAHLHWDSKFSCGTLPYVVQQNYIDTTTLVHIPKSRWVDERNEQLFVHGHLFGVAWELKSRFTFDVAMLLPTPPTTSHIAIYNFTFGPTHRAKRLSLNACFLKKPSFTFVFLSNFPFVWNRSWEGKPHNTTRGVTEWDQHAAWWKDFGHEGPKSSRCRDHAHPLHGNLNLVIVINCSGFKVRLGRN